MSDSKVVIKLEWPWTMMPLELVNEWIEAIKNGLPTNEPLCTKGIFVSARRQDMNMLLIENDTDKTYAFLSFKQDLNSCNLNFNVVETIILRKKLSDKLNSDHIQAIELIKENG